MFFPIGDDNPSRSRPVVTWTLIAVNVLTFLFVNVGADDETLYRTFVAWGFLSEEPVSIGLLTSMFLHGDFVHLLGNMWTFWIVGDNVEDKLGKGRFLACYLIGGAIASWAYVVTSTLAPNVGEALGEVGAAAATQTPVVPLVGASGAVFAVMGLYVVFFPEARIKMLFWFFLFMQILNVRAKWFIGGWVVLDLVRTVIARGPAFGGVATAAHVGGAVFGIAIGIWLKPRVGGGGLGGPWDVHTGFAKTAEDSHRAGWLGRRLARLAPPDPTESSLVRIERAIVDAVRNGFMDAAVDLYPRYEAMSREQPLPGPVQIEIAHEFFRRSLHRAAYEAYVRYIETVPRGDDVGEAYFRAGVLLARAFRRHDDALDFLGRARDLHPDAAVRDYAEAEMARLRR